MIPRTDQEILDKAQEIWDEEDSKYNKIEFGVVRERKAILLTVRRMYDAPGLSFKQLQALADFFGTQAINDEERFALEGCDTCDYGSSYGFTLKIAPEAA